MTGRRKDDDPVWAVTDRARPPSQRAYARRMRSDPTDAERKLWWHLRHRLELRETHFRRQVRIGPYIADFANHRLKLVIEIDGSQHAELESDAARTRRLEADGYCVLRFWNNDVLTNINGVLEAIVSAISLRPPPPTPPHKGEG
jgi:very-short-patch-repair endonuclease